MLSSSAHQLLLPIVTMCGRYSSVCPLTTPSSSPGIIWCARCNSVSPHAAFSSS